MVRLAPHFLADALGGDDLTSGVSSEDATLGADADPFFFEQPADPVAEAVTTETTTANVTTTALEAPAAAHDGGFSYDSATSDTRTQHFDSGALITSDGDGNATYYRGPSYYDESGVLKSNETMLDEARWWADYRLERGLNTLGPDGSEANPAWSLFGRGSSERQLWGAYHDLQALSVDQQAADYINQYPDEAASVARNERLVSGVSVAAGYAVTVAAERLSQLPFVELPAAELGARASAHVFSLAGYSVPAVDPVIRARWSRR